MSPTKPVDPGGTGDLFADAGVPVAAPTGQRKDDTARAKAPEATAWAWCPRCGPAAAKRVGLWQITGHYVWALHNRQREIGGSALCQASRELLCRVPPTHCHVCRVQSGSCPGEHVGALLLRQPTRSEQAEAASAATGWALNRISTPLDGTCIGMHAPLTPES